LSIEKAYKYSGFSVSVHFGFPLPGSLPFFDLFRPFLIEKAYNTVVFRCRATLV